jgi:enediyne biosynthesis protein E4
MHPLILSVMSSRDWVRKTPRRDVISWPYAIMLPVALKWMRIVIALGIAMAPTVSIGQTRFRFEDIHERAGLNQPHHGTGQEEWLPRLMICGMALFDYDNDGSQDIVLLNQIASEALDLRTQDDNVSAVLLYRNLGEGKFRDVTAEAGLMIQAYALGIAVADSDNDGDQDFAISTFGPTRYLVNQGDGTFLEQGPSSGIAVAKTQYGAGISFVDIDNDGCLDLYSSSYVDFTVQHYEAVKRRAFPYPPGPKDFLPSADQLYRNLGDGRFEDVSLSSGIAKLPGPTMGIICGDWDEDGDQDIFLCSDAQANQLLVNDGTGHFVDQSTELGVAFDGTGNINGNMGVDAGDYDGDGWIDLLVTSYTGQYPILYRNMGSGIFEDVSRRTQIGRTLLPHTNWGVVWFDAENDGDLDAFMANGHFLKNIKSIDDRTDYRVANTLMENRGDGRFRDVSSESGPGFAVKESSRGAAFADLDSDGDCDGVILNADCQPTLLENRSTPLGHWMSIRLIGRIGNRDGIGAKVTIRSDRGTVVRSVHSGRSYQSHYGIPLHFGLGDATRVHQITVQWPSGVREVFDCDGLDQFVSLIEGMGRP